MARSIPRSLLLAGCLGGVPADAATAPTWIRFDHLPDGTQVSSQFAEQGVRFINDYVPGQGYRACPQIAAYPQARSSPNVLVNTAFDPEVSSSSGVPLVIQFAQPVSGVGVQLGCVGDCGSVTGATVRLHGPSGVVTQRVVLPNPQFLTAVQLLDPGGCARVLTIDYGQSPAPEAIDDLAFQFSGAACQNFGAQVHITSHTNNQFVNSSAILLRGVATNSSGLVSHVTANGAPAQLTPRSAAGDGNVYYEWNCRLTLQPGANPVAAVAWDGSQTIGSQALLLHYGAPATVALTQFHLTQRGIMQNSACDADSPLVAGKFTIVRIQLDVRTALGEPSYVDAVELSLYRRIEGADHLVDTVWGTLFSPYVSSFQSPSQMAGIHFWIRGDQVDAAGDYALRFQPCLGLDPIGPPLAPPCASPVFSFEETRPIRLYILGAEAPVFSPLLGEQHVQDAFAQLSTVVRAYPIRDGWCEYWDPRNMGLKVTFGGPLLFCDGTAAMTSGSSYCQGTGYEWTFKDTHPSGIWRADHAQVVDLSRPTCQTNGLIGGRLASTNLFNLPPAGSFGVFRGGAHPGDERKYFVPFDDNHNGQIDADDLAHYIGEYWNGTQWSTDLAGYLPGQTFRQFQDQNSDNCFVDGEGESPVVRLWRHANTMLFGPLEDARKRFNDFAFAGDAAAYGSLWFPDRFHPQNGEFFMYGPGGSDGGVLSWARVRHDQTMAHELGHNIAGLKDLYWPWIPQSDRDVPAWQAYVFYRQVNAAGLTDIMDASTNPDDHFFKSVNYLAVFNKLRSGSSAKSAAGQAGLGQIGFRVWGLLQGDTLLSVASDTAWTDDFSEPDPESAWFLRLRDERAALLEHRFPVRALHQESRQPLDASDMLAFDAVVPLDPRAVWVELWRGRRLLWQLQRSANAPQVQVLAPNGGESFGSDEPMLIRWSAGDADGDRLRFSVSNSPGGGRWMVLATGLRGEALQWNTDRMAGGREAIIRVTAEDGFHSGADDSDRVFTVAGKPPVAAIEAPTAGSRFLEGQPIPLRGHGYDPEGLPLTFTWAINGRYAGGQSMVLLPARSPGQYAAELAVRDTDGELATATSSFTVLADSDRDGMSDEFELAHGLDPSLAADAMADDDRDGVASFDESWRGLNPRHPDTDGDGAPDGEEIQAGANPLDPLSRPPCQPPPEDLASWWPADQHALDLIGENHGSTGAGTSFAPGKVAAAFQFDGRSGVVIPHHPSLLPSALTIAVWIYPTTYDANRILEKGGYRVTGGYGLEFNPFGNRRVRFVIWNTVPVVVDSDEPIPINSWTHVAGTFDGSTMKLYVNGVEQGGSQPAWMSGNLAPLCLGRASAANDLPFLGALDEVMLFHRALTAEEIAAIAQAGSAGACKPGSGQRPALILERAGGSLEISWPLCPGWTLEETPRLDAPAPWAPVDSPCQGRPGQFYLPIPTSAETRFYRLRWP
ncbi:MAG: LamG domain-containing protein [Verrucomicrobia bacterium]|nr:LamG domain-containing protein [Verrucomicrobiota bacterium]